MSWQKLLLRLFKKHRGHQANGKLIEQIEQLADEASPKQKYSDQHPNILLPVYLSSYVVTFVYFRIEEGTMHVHTIDDKTGAADSFENYKLDKKDLKLVKQARWPDFQPEKFQHIYAAAGFSQLFD